MSAAPLAMATNACITKRLGLEMRSGELMRGPASNLPARVSVLKHWDGR